MTEGNHRREGSYRFSDHYQERKFGRGFDNGKVKACIDEGWMFEAEGERWGFEKIFDGISFVIIMEEDNTGEADNCVITGWTRVSDAETALSKESQWSSNFVNIVQRNEERDG